MKKSQKLNNASHHQGLQATRHQLWSRWDLPQMGEDSNSATDWHINLPQVKSQLACTNYIDMNIHAQVFPQHSALWNRTWNRHRPCFCDERRGQPSIWWGFHSNPICLQSLFVWYHNSERFIPFLQFPLFSMVAKSIPVSVHLIHDNREGSKGPKSCK